MQITLAAPARILGKIDLKSLGERVGERGMTVLGSYGGCSASRILNLLDLSR
jgi:hypothetical protein